MFQQMLRLNKAVNGEVQSSNSGTYRYEFPRGGAIKGVIVELGAVNGSTYNVAQTIEDVISSIVIVADGHNILYSMTPHVAKELTALSGLHHDGIYADQRANARQKLRVFIPFGRNLHDDEYFLSLSNYKSVELQVNYNLSPIAVTGWSTGSFSVSVSLLEVQNTSKLSYKGLLVSREIRTVTTSASGELALEIPTNALVRQLGIYAYKAATAFDTIGSNLKLSVDNGTFLHFDSNLEDLQVLTQHLYGMKQTRSYYLMSDDPVTYATRQARIQTIDTVTLGDIDDSGETLQVFSLSSITGDTVVLSSGLGDFTSGAESLALNTNIVPLGLNVSSMAPNFMGLFRFAEPDNETGYMNIAKLNKLEFILTQSVSGATVKLFTQELRGT